MDTRSRASDLPPGLVGLDGGAVGAELDRLAACVLELRAHVGVDEIARLDPLEPVLLEPFRVLCLQQSASDSARPEVDVPPAFLADGLLDRHVGDLNPSARSEHPEQF